MEMINKCRPRTMPDQFPGMSDDDLDALGILAWASSAMVDGFMAGRPPEDHKKTLGELFSREQLDAIAIMNHAMTYLEHRDTYEDEIRPELYGYLRIK